MLSKVLVPLDGSAVAEAPLTALRPLLAALGSSVELLTATGSRCDDEHRIGDSGLFLGNADLHAALVGYHQRLLDRLAAADIVGSSHVVEAAPVDAIFRRLGDDDAPDGVAMTTHGRWGFSTRRLGHVAQRTLYDAQVPLLFVPARVSAPDQPPRRPDAIGHVVLALTPDDLAEGAVARVAHVIERTGARLSILLVEPSSHHSTLPDDKARAALDRLASMYGAAGIDPETCVRRGPALARVVAENATGLEADLLIIGHREADESWGWLFGDPAEKLLREVEQPVLVLRLPS